MWKRLKGLYISITAIGVISCAMAISADDPFEIIGAFFVFILLVFALIEHHEEHR